MHIRGLSRLRVGCRHVMCDITGAAQQTAVGSSVWRWGQFWVLPILVTNWDYLFVMETRCWSSVNRSSATLIDLKSLPPGAGMWESMATDVTAQGDSPTFWRGPSSAGSTSWACGPPRQWRGRARQGGTSERGCCQSGSSGWIWGSTSFSWRLCCCRSVREGGWGRGRVRELGHLGAAAKLGWRSRIAIKIQKEPLSWKHQSLLLNSFSHGTDDQWKCARASLIKAAYQNTVGGFRTGISLANICSYLLNLVVNLINVFISFFLLWSHSDCFPSQGFAGKFHVPKIPPHDMFFSRDFTLRWAF